MVYPARRRDRPLDYLKLDWFDRNPTTKVTFYEATVGYHVWTQRFSYTVPTAKKYQNQLFFGYIDTVTAAGTFVFIKIQIGNYVVYFLAKPETAPYVTAETVPAPFLLVAGEVLTGYTMSTDSVNHHFCLAAVGTQFTA